MPFLEAEAVQELLVEAREHRRKCAFCQVWLAKDYCRSCDEFFWNHAPTCSLFHDHSGHRLTITPFVEDRGV